MPNNHKNRNINRNSINNYIPEHHSQHIITAAPTPTEEGTVRQSVDNI